MRGSYSTSLPFTPTYDFADPESDGADICWYGTNVQNLSSTLPQQQSLLQIDRGVDFYWVGTSFQADVTTAGDNSQTEYGIVIPIVSVLVQDAASGKYIENLSFPVSSIGGAGERPYGLIIPRVIRGATAMAFYWKALSAGGITYNNLYLVLHGYTRPAA